jgi:multiple sugar transport system ATP-binding protein
MDAHGRPVHAVRDLSLDVADGEFVVLVGPSGCGKSTTLRLIAGLDACTSGSIRIGGRAVEHLEPRHRDVAMVFQNYALYPHMTVFENMAFGLQLRKVPAPEIRQRVHETAGSLGLSEFLHRLPKALSGGQRQRVALGRAIVRQPSVFLLDEPLSNLDAQLRVQTRMELARLHQRLKTTMIYVTHDQVEAMTLGQRIVVMHRGEIQQCAPPLTVYHQPANLFVAGFLGSPPMNLLDVSLHPSPGDSWRIHSPDLSLDWTLPWEALPPGLATHRQVRLGIRPEDIRMTPPHTPVRDKDALEPDASLGPTILGEVELVERLGPESWIHVRQGSRIWLARGSASPDSDPARGMSACLVPNLLRAHWFDAVSGHRIHLPQADQPT